MRPSSSGIGMSSVSMQGAVAGDLSLKLLSADSGLTSDWSLVTLRMNMDMQLVVAWDPAGDGADVGRDHAFFMDGFGAPYLILLKASSNRACE